MDHTLLGIVGVLALLALLGLGVHVAFSMAIVGFAGLVFLTGPEAAVQSIALVPFMKLNTFLFAVVPLFILMGYLAYESGITGDAFDFAYKWFGGLRGGLAMASVVAGALFGAACGATAASAGALGRICTPEMRRRGYDDGLATGTVAAAGTLATMIPPSINMVLYGIITGTSIGKLLIAGILPGIMIATTFIAMIGIRAWRKPTLAPVLPLRVSWTQKITSAAGVVPIMVLFLAVMGSIYTGFATPTEAAAVGAVGAIVIAAARRKLSIKTFRGSLVETTRTVSMVFFILTGSFLFAVFLAVSGLSTDVSQWLISLPVPNIVILVGICLLYIVLGCFMDPISMMVVTMPIVFPAVTTMGYDPVWFGVVIILLIEIGLITPPFGMTVFIVQGVNPDVRIQAVFRGIAWFVATALVALALLIAFPQIALWLPNNIGG